MANLHLKEAMDAMESKQTAMNVLEVSCDWLELFKQLGCAVAEVILLRLTPLSSLIDLTDQ